MNVTEKELAWLAGIIDGEGSFNLSASKDRNGCFVTKYAVSIGNTSLALILEAKRIMELIVGPGYVVGLANGFGHKRSTKNKASALTYLFSLDSIRVFCIAITPYLVDIIGIIIVISMMIESVVVSR